MRPLLWKPLSPRERGWGEGQRRPFPSRFLASTTAAIGLGWMALRDGFSVAFRWCRSPRGPYFSLLVQRKVGKRNTPRRSARRCAAGAQSRREFSCRASPYRVRGRLCPVRKRRTSLCAALRVLHAGPAGPQGPPRATPETSRPLLCFCLPSGPHEARRVGRVQPEGRRHG